jgi:transcriptional regulator
MYVPNHYRSEDFEDALEIIRTNPLATVVSVVEGRPYVSYLPLTVETIEPALVLSGHCARANPHWKYFEGSPLLVIFRGVDGYISPRFYQDCSTNVPSWNYVAVHCTGTASIASVDDVDAILEKLVAQMEEGAESPWRVDDLLPEVFTNFKKAIVPFRITVSNVDAKFKLSQRGSDGDVAGLIKGLRESGAEGDGRLADAMERARKM